MNTTCSTRRRGRMRYKDAEMARRLLAGAGLGVTPQGVRSVIASAPATQQEAGNPDPCRSVCVALLCAWESKPMGGGEYREFEVVTRYWLDERPRG